MRRPRPVLHPGPRTRAIITLALVLSLSWAPIARAQLIVHDPGNFIPNTLTSIQQTLNTLEAIAHTAYWILQITGFGGTLDEDFWRDVQAIQQIAGDAAQIGRDIASINTQLATFFDIGSGPISAAGLAQRQAEIRREIMKAHSAALRAQTLVRTARNTLNHIRNLISRIENFLGEKQALQNINESLTTITRLESSSHTTVAAFQQAQTIEAMEAPIVQETIRRINVHFCGRVCQPR